MKNLIKIISAVTAVLGMAATSQATLFTFNYNSGFANGGVIPDGNPAGWSDTRTLTTGDLGTDTYIQDVNVVLNISGGYNGDLYGYLVHSSGFCVLLNRVGSGSAGGAEPGTTQYVFGFSTSGFNNVTLDDAAGTSIHAAGAANPANETYASDGGTLSSFNGLNALGSWTLFLADMSAPDTGTVTSWSLELNAVPEPVTWALIIFAGLAGAVNVGRRVQRRVRSADARIGS